MASVFCWFAVILVLACAVLHFTHRRKLACWLLVILPAGLSIGLFVDMVQGAVKLGEASYKSDLRTLPYLLGYFAVTLIAAFRSKWAWLFWLAWVFSACLCAILVFLTYFWKVFS